MCVLFLPHSSLVLLFTPGVTFYPFGQFQPNLAEPQNCWFPASFMKTDNWADLKDLRNLISTLPSTAILMPMWTATPPHPSQTCRKADICVQVTATTICFQSGFTWESGIKDARLSSGCRWSHKSSQGTRLLSHVMVSSCLLEAWHVPVKEALEWKMPRLSQ